MKRNYCAYLHLEKGKDVGVTFPDFDGCVTVGSNSEDALREAEEVLQFHIEGMVDERLDIPEPTHIDDLIDSIMNFKEKICVAYINVEIPESKTKRVNMTIPEYVLSKADNYLKIHSEIRSRSELFTTAFLDYCTK